MLASIVRQRGGQLFSSIRHAVSASGRRWKHHDPPPSQLLDSLSGPSVLEPISSAPAPLPLIQSLRSATTSYELFEIVSLQRKQFTAEHVMIALRRLFQLQKTSDPAPLPNKHILKNPDFEHLCRNLKHVSRSLDVNDLIDAMKILNFVGVPPNSEISMTLLHLVRTQINDISLGQIIFLDFLMTKFESTPLVDAFRIALPMLMQIQLGSKMDHENRGQLTDLLQFVTRHSVSEQARMNVISALTMHGTELSLDEACSIVWSLTDLRVFEAPHEKLLHNCFEVLCDSLLRLPFDAVETTLSKMVNKYHGQRVPAFYDEEFFGRVASYVIDRDVGFLNAIYIQRKFTRVNYVSLEMIEYMAEKICADPQLLSAARPTILLTFVSALTTAFYKPVAWETLRPLVAQNPFVASAAKADMPWLRFVLELVALDIVDEECVDKICEPAFVKQTLSRTVNTLDMLQLLLLHQVVEVLLPRGYRGSRLPEQVVEKAKHIQLQRQEMPLRAGVERCFGGRRNVLSAVVTRLGHFVDHVVVFDGEGRVVQMQEAEGGDAEDGEWENVRFEEIRVPDGHKAVAIVTFPRSHYCLNVPRLKGMFHLRVRTLEALTGCRVCVFNADAWAELPDHEKLGFVEREVRHKLA